MKTPKAIVFDYGGVIELFHGKLSFEIAADISGLPIEQISEAYFKNNHLSNAKNMRWVEMFAVVLDELNISSGQKKEILDLVKANEAKRSLNQELLDLLPVLKEKGFSLSIFSNYTSGLRNKLKDQKIDHLFDEVVISGEIGHQKPSEEAFAKLFEVLDVSPEDVVFIDDTPKSLETATTIGYHPILFESTERLVEQLQKVGIDVSKK